jgi:ABC-2 type transport system permease protein
LILPAARSAAKGSLNLKIFTLISFSVFLVQVFFVGIGLFISVLMRKIKSVMPVTLAVVFAFFIIELINQSLLDEKLTYFTPFSYFKGSDIISRTGYDPKYLAIDLAVFAVLTVLSLAIYRKKDIRAV